MIYRVQHTLPFGTVCIESDGTYITSVTYGTGDTTETCPVIEQCISQLEEYAVGQRLQFTVPYLMQGTAFQQSVWSALTDIPYGQTRTYGEIAAQIEQPKAARAVGNACNKNPLLLLVPCHRVVGSDGRLTGFAAGLHIKAALLNLEQTHHTNLVNHRKRDAYETTIE